MKKLFYIPIAFIVIFIICFVVIAGGIFLYYQADGPADNYKQVFNNQAAYIAYISFLPALLLSIFFLYLYAYKLKIPGIPSGLVISLIFFISVAFIFPIIITNNKPQANEIESLPEKRFITYQNFIILLGEDKHKDVENIIFYNKLKDRNPYFSFARFGFLENNHLETGNKSIDNSLLINSTLKAPVLTESLAKDALSISLNLTKIRSGNPLYFILISLIFTIFIFCDFLLTRTTRWPLWNCLISFLFLRIFLYLNSVLNLENIKKIFLKLGMATDNILFSAFVFLLYCALLIALFLILKTPGSLKGNADE